MNKNERERWAHFTARAFELGLTFQDIESLRRDAMRLTRWAENECNGLIERDAETDKVFRVYNTEGPGPIKRFPTADRETPAKKRVSNILAARGLVPYFQGDPRGEPIYILTKDQNPDNYTAGLAVPTFL